MKRTVGWILFFLSSSSIADGLYTRDLACEQQPSSRAKEICQALEQSLKWRWTGHAIISPSFRVNFEGVRHAYCTLPITANDTELLVDMAFDSGSRNGMRYVQINNGVRSLLSILGQQALEHFPALDKISDESRRSHAQYLKEHISLAIAETSSSIFNPAHRYYILRDGCQ